MKLKLFLITIYLLIFSSSLLAQINTAKQNTNKLQSTKTIMEYYGLSAKLSWDSFQITNPNKTFILPNDVSTDIDHLILIYNPTNQTPISSMEYKLLKKYQIKIDSFFNSLTLFGSSQLAKFVYSKSNNEIPVKFCMQNDTSLTILIKVAFIDKIFNVSSLTTRQRAKTIIIQYLLPTIKEIYKCLQTSTEIKYFGMSCVYGTKDYSDSGVFSTTSESVSCIVPAKSMNKFIKNDLTEDELIRIADIYIIERGLASELKKIKVGLE